MKHVNECAVDALFDLLDVRTRFLTAAYRKEGYTTEKMAAALLEDKGRAAILECIVKFYELERHTEGEK